MKSLAALIGVAFLVGCSATGGVGVDPRVTPVATCDALNEAVTRVQNKRDTVGLTPLQQQQLTTAVNNGVKPCASDVRPDPAVISLYIDQMLAIAPPLEGVN